MLISKKYLIALTDENAPEKCIVATDENSRFLFQLNIRASREGIPFYLDVERYIGKKVVFLCKDEEFSFDGEADNVEQSESIYRPKLHYTVPYGWLNDPNGLIFIDGKYHIFCQHNPLGTAWGNMHWHHSTTSDFIIFEHLGDALFPNDMGTMFSGSAICDADNVSGVGKNAILLFYTIAEYAKASGCPEFSQGLAYSSDGVHFKKYKNNPVVPNIKGENRDPKVIFVPEIDSYVMALYLEENEYCLLKSDNLIDWKLFQRINIPCDSECPDLYYLKESKKWILSGASDNYIIGHFTAEGFIPEQKPLLFYRELDGRYSYAAQSFSGTDDRILRLSWENINPEYGQGFCGQLSVPLEMSLVALQDKTLRLKGSIPREIESKLEPIEIGYFSNIEIDEEAFVADFSFNDDFTVSVDKTAFNISAENNTLSLGNKSIPLSISGEKNMRFIIDKMSIEILADGGLIFTCVKALSAKSKRTLEITNNNVKTTIYKLKE